MLDLLDKELESRGHKFVRYADDISIFTSSQRGAERILTSLNDWIERRLKLKVNREKSGIRRPSSGNLLGFGFWHGTGGAIQARVSTKSYEWGNTRKGYWRTAHSPILQTTVTIERLKQKGYVPLMDSYTLRRKTLVNRRDTRTVRPVV